MSEKNEPTRRRRTQHSRIAENQQSDRSIYARANSPQEKPSPYQRPSQNQIHRDYREYTPYAGNRTTKPVKKKRSIIPIFASSVSILAIGLALVVFLFVNKNNSQIAPPTSSIDNSVITETVSISSQNEDKDNDGELIPATSSTNSIVAEVMPDSSMDENEGNNEDTPIITTVDNGAVAETTPLSMLNESERVIYDSLIIGLEHFYNKTEARLMKVTNAVYEDDEKTILSYYIVEISGTNKLGGRISNFYKLMIQDPDNRELFTDVLISFDDAYGEASSIMEAIFREAPQHEDFDVGNINRAIKYHWDKILGL